MQKIFDVSKSGLKDLGQYRPYINPNKMASFPGNIDVKKSVNLPFSKGDNIRLERFTERLKDGTLKDPKSGQIIKKDRAYNSSHGGHGGSYWKLLEAI